jgi:site-specific DNA-methyltransferase (adenine-specific)
MSSEKQQISIVQNRDCMEAMAEFPDKFFELAIVDPPYGIGEDGSKNKTRGNLSIAKNYQSFSGQDKKAPGVDFFNELRRISKNQIVWGANHFISHIPYDSPSWVVWDKQNSANDFADCELAWASFKCAVRKFDYKWNGMLQADMKNKEHRIHPTQKPIALYKWLLANYAKPGDKILDTHLGSGSSRIAAWDMGFDFWGYELSEHYYTEQEKRFKAHISKPVLFAPEEMYQAKQSTLFEQ